MFKNCAPFPSCISRINNSQEDNAQYIDVVIPMYNLIEYNGYCWKTSGTLWQHCRDEPDLAADNTITDFIEANVITDSFKRKDIIKGQTGDNGTKNMEIMKPLKYLSNFWKTLEMPLINCEINLSLKWSEKATNVSKGYWYSSSINNIFNNWYNTLCLSCNFIDSR